MAVNPDEHARREKKRVSRRAGWEGENVISSTFTVTDV